MIIYLFQVTNEDNEDVWDDSALIKAYDKAINLAKEKVVKRMGIDVQDSQLKENIQNFKQPKHTSKPKKVVTNKIQISYRY